MKIMPSSKFRVSFHDLAEETQVTVHGRVIGTWVPSGPSGIVVAGDDVLEAAAEAVKARLGARTLAEIQQEIVNSAPPRVIVDGRMRVASQSFTPAPKPPTAKKASKRK